MKTLAKLLNAYQEKHDLSNEQVAKKLKMTKAHFAAVKYNQTTHIGVAIGEKILKLLPAAKRGAAKKDIQKTNKNVLMVAKARFAQAKKASKKKSSKKTSKKKSSRKSA